MFGEIALISECDFSGHKCMIKLHCHLSWEVQSFGPILRKVTVLLVVATSMLNQVDVMMNFLDPCCTHYDDSGSF